MKIDDNLDHGNTAGEILGRIGACSITISPENRAYAANDPRYRTFEEDPIRYLTCANAWEVQKILEDTSGTSTKIYVKSFMQCMKHMPDFEAKVAQKFLDNSNLNQSVILALVYLMQYPKIYTQTFSHLNNIVSRCSSSQVSTILKLMHDIGLRWGRDELDDPIMKQFLTKAYHHDTGLKLIV